MGILIGGERLEDLPDCWASCDTWSVIGHEVRTVTQESMIGVVSLLGVAFGGVTLYYPTP